MSASLDLSIIIVHTYEKHQLRQTLRGIRRAAPQLNFEVIVVDNNPGEKLHQDVLKVEFPETKYIPLDAIGGFGAGMNHGIRVAKGRYVLIFNPDIVVQPGSLEAMMKFMDENPDVGLCGPRLENPDGTLQYSCYRIPTAMLPVYRRTPLGKTHRGKQEADHYLMKENSHDQTMDVDALIGAALFTRKEALDEVGLFDEQFFMYYEDNDLCRRFWEKGHRVVYLPEAQMMHYHRRASADGGLFRQLTSRFTWIQIASFVKYWKKYREKENPRESHLITRSPWRNTTSSMK